MSVDSMTSGDGGTVSSPVSTTSGMASNGVGSAGFGAVGGTEQTSATPNMANSSSSSTPQNTGASKSAQLGNADGTEQADQGNGKESTVANTPFTAEAYTFAMPSAVANDSALVSRIQDFCVSSQLSPQQAQAAMNFWQHEQNAAMEQGLKQCEQSLKERWQGGYEQRLEQARSTLKMLDNRMEGRLMPLMKGPLGNSPVFAEMLDKLADVVGETTMEVGGMGGTRGSYTGSQRMSTEDFLRQVVFK